MSFENLYKIDQGSSPETSMDRDKPCPYNSFW